MVESLLGIIVQYNRSAKAEKRFMVRDSRPWRRAAPFSAAITLLLLALFTGWFAFANRYRLFLYYHDMGPLVPDTSPFSRVTASRYWMAGLVAGGLICVVYGGFHWLSGRQRPGFVLPSWPHVWLLCLPGLLLGLPALTMTANDPVLPARLALAVVVAAVAALALALWPGELAARRPLFLAGLLADGFGLALLLTFLAQADDMVVWAAAGRRAPLVLAALALAASVGLLFLFSLRFLWPGAQLPTAVQSFLGGCVVAYLLLPLAHHLLFSDGYFYITDSDNFLAGSWALQIGVWLVVFALAALLARLRRWLQQKSRAAQATRLSLESR